METVILGNIEVRDVTLNDVFKKEVLDRRPESSNFVWYVDHWTENTAEYNVCYIAGDARLLWTDENLDQRDLQDPQQNWEPNDVAEWFSKFGDTIFHAHTIVFTVPGGLADPNATFIEAPATHELRIAAFHVSLDGDERDGALWKSYCDMGIKGALAEYADLFGELVEVRIEESAQVSLSRAR